MFRTRLRELREANGYKSQQAFADAFGVAQSTVGNWEAGKREPNYETTMRLAEFFHVSVGYLLGSETQDEYSAKFRINLSVVLSSLDVDAFSGEEDAIYDYNELMSLTESAYPLSLAEACLAADKVGESLDSLLQGNVDYAQEDDDNEKSPSTDESILEDEQNRRIMGLVAELTPEQKVLLLALLNTALEQNRGRLAFDQVPIDEKSLKFEH